ncbi:hypothetical protein ACLOJK_033214 [Asimina triloba]
MGSVEPRANKSSLSNFMRWDVGSAGRGLTNTCQRPGRGPEEKHCGPRTGSQEVAAMDEVMKIVVAWLVMTPQVDETLVLRLQRKIDEVVMKVVADGEG